MDTFFKILTISLMYSMCNNSTENLNTPIDHSNKIICTDTNCKGTYSGAEFIRGADIAHQFSNKMSKSVGDKLKQLYDKKLYSKVDFSNIVMTTKGMGTGNVNYHLEIPIVLVEEKCDAFTSFDHVGGWNHKPALIKRKKELNKLLLKGDQLYISNLKTTKEDLQEYWIQWKNNIKQIDCVIF